MAREATCGALEALPPCLSCALPAGHAGAHWFATWEPAKRSESPLRPRADPLLSACTRESHAELKADDKKWERETVPPVGHATRPVMGDGDEFIQIANCRRCHSTLARAVEIKLEDRR